MLLVEKKYSPDQLHFLKNSTATLGTGGQNLSAAKNQQKHPKITQPQVMSRKALVSVFKAP